jgi:hypothetical protein
MIFSYYQLLSWDCLKNIYGKVIWDIISPVSLFISINMSPVAPFFTINKSEPSTRQICFYIVILSHAKCLYKMFNHLFLGRMKVKLFALLSTLIILLAISGCIGTEEEKDSDGDGYLDADDAFPDDPTEWSDLDGDGVGDNSDFNPYDSSETKDSDGDGIGDKKDVFPNNPNEWSDSDKDDVGDNSDAFPYDPSEWKDSDGDGLGDNTDEFPLDANETKDSDGDGVGDNGDDFPRDPKEWKDSDGDGVGDNADEMPYDPYETKDSDGDGVGNNGDAFPYDPNEWADSDGDGVGDNADEFPDDPAASVDSDGDDYPEEWNPGKTEADSTTGLELDEFPDDLNEWKDSDGDGVGDNADEFPDDPTRSKTIYNEASLPPRSGWIDSDGNTTHIEEYNFLESDIYEVRFQVLINDSDEAHADTDEGSDPDLVYVTLQGGEYLDSFIIETPINWAMGWSSDFLLPNDWTVTIEGLEFGNKSVLGPFGLIVYVDQGIAWAIFVDYVYLTYG